MIRDVPTSIFMIPLPYQQRPPPLLSAWLHACHQSSLRCWKLSPLKVVAIEGCRRRRLPASKVRCFTTVTHRRGQHKNCLKQLLPENPLMEALVAESKELLTWALVKVAHPGDTVVTLHVLGNQGDDSRLILWDARSAPIVTV
ncbi:hypothetical protein V8G54_035553 [Vigna mungo]|uniref:Uncharacterized protein n=1 Tax=Vigna mungo TaxID=3915 RepID=A0AAQ3MF68_VIGMU